MNLKNEKVQLAINILNLENVVEPSNGNVTKRSKCFKFKKLIVEK